MTEDILHAGRRRREGPSAKRAVPHGAAMLDAVRQVVRSDLAPLVVKIDTDGVYPQGVLRKLGAAGCYAAYAGTTAVPEPDLSSAIEATALVAEHCLSTAFCVWCQNACAWYLHHTENAWLKAELLDDVVVGDRLGGTGLSNPMKALSGLEPLRLKGKRVSAGYVVEGRLPFVSNLGPDHPFGIVFETENGRKVMALATCGQAGIGGGQTANFCALEGTRTWSLRFTDCFIPDSMVLADPLGTFARQIQPGFVLLQTGLPIGLVRSCIGIMRQFKNIQAGVNGLLDDNPDNIEEELKELESVTHELARLPSDEQVARVLDILDTRLMLAELGLRAAQAAMLYTGARGYLKSSAPQRKLREAYFVAILTPTIKHLRHDTRQNP